MENPHYLDSSSDSSTGSSLMFLLDAVEQAEVEDTGCSKRRSKGRDRQKALKTLMEDYFNEDAKYNEADFRKNYRLTKRLFLKIVGDIEAKYEWFQPGQDARGQASFTAIQKCISAIGQLATGNPPYEYDNYLKMSERTSRECLDYFCIAVLNLYSEEFLRRPTSHDVALLYLAHEERHHIPGMLGSIDCTHFDWRNCPIELQGQYRRGDHRHPTIMLEIVASEDLWIWHAYYGVAGSNNDINVLNQSTLFLQERNGTAPNSQFEVNGRTYKRGYFLADGGYPSWSTFVKAISYPGIPKERKFNKLQMGSRKDVERCFGSLKARWGILRREMRSTTKRKLANIVNTCLILHNMMLKEDGWAISPVHIRDPPVNPVFDEDALQELRDEQMHLRLRYDLIEHIDAQNLPYLEEDPGAAAN